MKSIFLLALAGLSAGFVLSAGDDLELKINGHFRGAAVGAATVPGWSPEATPGSTKILPGKGKNFLLEISAPPTDNKSVFSNLYPVSGRTLKIEADGYGTGDAFISCLYFDAQKKQLQVNVDSKKLTLSPVSQKYKFYFDVPGNTAYLRIVLTATAGRTVVFGDVEAEFKFEGKAFQPGASFNSSKSYAFHPQEGRTSEKVTAESAVVIPANAVMIIDDQKLDLGRVPDNAVYQISTAVGSDIEFKLGEDTSKQKFWSLDSYDPVKCKIKLKHDSDGVFPLRFDFAEIELKPMVRGISVVKLCYGGTKKITVYLKGY